VSRFIPRTRALGKVGGLAVKQPPRPPPPHKTTSSSAGAGPSPTSASSSASSSSDAIPAFVPARLTPPPLQPLAAGPAALDLPPLPPQPPRPPSPLLIVTPSAHSFTAGHTPGRVRWGLPVPTTTTTQAVGGGADAAAASDAPTAPTPAPPTTTTAASTATLPPPHQQQQQPHAYTPASPFTHVVELYRGAVSTVSSAVCGVTGRPVILKAYDSARMRPRHVARVGREVAAMAALGPGGGVVSLLGHFEAGPVSGGGGGGGPSSTTTSATTATHPSPPPPPRRGTSGGPVLVMEHCARGDLFKALVLAGGGGLGGAYTASAVVGPLLATLVRAHAAGWIHRDIKPENLFVAADGRVLLGDWGLAMHTPSEPAFARAGTLDYMAPEVLANPATDLEEGCGGGWGGGGTGGNGGNGGLVNGKPLAAALAAAGVRPYGPAVDVWAVGVLAYELVTGRPPFEAGGGGGHGDEGATAARILHSTSLAWPSHLTAAESAGAGPAWVAFVKACLAKDPARRPRAADALRLPWVAAHFSPPPALEGGHLLAAGGMTAAAVANAGGGPARPASASVTVVAAAPSAPLPPAPAVVVEEAEEGEGGAAGAPPPPPPPPPPPARPPPNPSTTTAPLVGGSGDGEAAARGVGGLRVRVAHYFSRQRAAGGARVGVPPPKQ
jgi:serine/threonine protein kinase